MTANGKRRGNCYVTCEALYHLLGGKLSGLTPHTIRHEGDVHWFLVYKRTTAFGVVTTIIDPTGVQFTTLPDYKKGRGRGFLTKKPSKRARAMMERMVWQ